MIRTRLVWFTTGFLAAGVSIASLIHRDLSRDRLLLLAQLQDNFGSLQTRVSNLEFVTPSDSNVQILAELIYSRRIKLGVRIKKEGFVDIKRFQVNVIAASELLCLWLQFNITKDEGSSS